MTHIKDVLKDLVSYAVPLSFNIVRVTGTDETTLFEGIDEDLPCCYESNGIRNIYILDLRDVLVCQISKH